jgi:uncharacterized membrane protein
MEQETVLLRSMFLIVVVGLVLVLTAHTPVAALVALLLAQHQVLDLTITPA